MGYLSRVLNRARDPAQTVPRLVTRGAGGSAVAKESGQASCTVATIIGVVGAFAVIGSSLAPTHWGIPVLACGLVLAVFGFAWVLIGLFND